MIERKCEFCSRSVQEGTQSRCFCQGRIQNIYLCKEHLLAVLRGEILITTKDYKREEV